MRLKTLFFPIMLVISISIFIGFIWPEISTLREVNEVNLAKKQEFEGIAAKKAAINSMGKQIAGGDSEKIVKEYLPEAKAEERIINNVNFLATDAGVSLVNVSLTGESASTGSADTTISGVAAALNPTAGAEAVLNSNGTSTPAVAAQTSKSVTASISVSGDYEKIRLFLGGLQHASIFNTVKSVTIAKQAEVKDEEGSVSNANTLLATAIVDFGYMLPEKVDNQKVETFKQKIDNETVETLKKYVSQKNQAIEINGGSKGRTNPFLVN